MFRSCVRLVVALSTITSMAFSEDDPSPETLLPASTVFYVEVPDPPQLLSTIFDHPLRSKIESLEPYKQAIRSEGYRGFLTARKFAEIQLGMEWRPALETLTAKGIYLAIDSSTRGVVVLIRGQDPESLEQLRSKLLELTKLGKNPDRIREGEYRGIAAYEANKAKFAVVRDWLVITNNSDTGQSVLDRLIDGEGPCLADNETYQTARSTRLSDATAWAFADLKTLREAGVAKAAFAGKSGNPAIELLVGGILSNLQHANFATARLSADTSEISLELQLPHQLNWVSEEREFYFGPNSKGQGPALPAPENTLFTLSTYRNVSEMWLRAGDLFDEAINDGIAEADANLTTLFAGKDFGEDILGALTPQMGFVAARQNFDHALPVPAIKLPQFALILTLQEPDTMTRELRRTFQSMIGFFNVIGAMEGRPQFELDMEKLEHGAELVTATYVPEQGDADSTQAEIFFNFSPSIGFRDERFVVASTSRLAKELVLADQPKQLSIPENTNATLQASALKDVLHDNREQLISQNMLEQGHSREEAEASIELLLQVLGYFKDASVRLHVEPNQLSLKLGVQLQQLIP